MKIPIQQATAGMICLPSISWIRSCLADEGSTGFCARQKLQANPWHGTL